MERRGEPKAKPVQGATVHRPILEADDDSPWHYAGPSLASIAVGLADLFFPRRCHLCESLEHPEPNGFCRSCAQNLNIEKQQPYCPGCGRAIVALLGKATLCADCLLDPSAVDGVTRVGAYRGSAGRLVRLYKFRHRREMEPILADMLAGAIAGCSWSSELEAIVPVPSHWLRRVWTQIHPSESLSRLVAKKLGIPCLSLIRRAQLRRRQLGLTLPQRLTNVRGAFAVRKGVRLDKAKLLLIDDVRTTGATINECARLLRKRGAAQIFAAVLAVRGLDDA